MNKYLLSALVVGSFSIYSWRVQTETKESLPLVTRQPTPEVKQKKAALYKDGQFQGDIVDAIYGDVQIAATVKDGELSDVIFLKYPDHHAYSKEINPEALPYLASEAIRVQSATVDIYSGATQTSKAFKKSLQSALDQTKL